MRNKHTQCGNLSLPRLLYRSTNGNIHVDDVFARTKFSQKQLEVLRGRSTAKHIERGICTCAISGLTYRVLVRDHSLRTDERGSLPSTQSATVSTSPTPDYAGAVLGFTLTEELYEYKRMMRCRRSLKNPKLRPLHPTIRQGKHDARGADCAVHGFR